MVHNRGFSREVLLTKGARGLLPYRSTGYSYTVLLFRENLVVHVLAMLLLVMLLLVMLLPVMPLCAMLLLVMLLIYCCPYSYSTVS